ncbi:MAG: hypothetical protein A3G39_04990 [Deltaproteobacteria bacterium RIFCSPLOWO2_12_FULL_43_16]|nr:MAG: hypothetical protein A3D30_05310 [Deltaproteobacteria bacterium RIFCSPHIGHO2_02_FULL_43_33]OGQ43080.1 MAG: hypothetical protein A3A85_02835 [Deltaproteobacteria bacterium RIFCSPLOWO2_01_FULL_42_9]OGQ44646.1 MAG: hypothetical protein A2W63_02020 [Deltaproteobacteria bacterium RIFCSPLOWO2_02_44_9]OGQ61225.1 MAG: hypothetical protein A3G39_04990 [Deltaproteobacteria bacterium RIFCSPLOWO2_12_FULL_43_16]HBR15992.1 hypothetical protein [Deltaproteobacteria bacterium]
MNTAAVHAIHNNPDDDLWKLLEKLYHEKRWDFRNYKKASLKRRISVRLSALNISSYKEYYKILESDPKEYDKLFSTITVKVSEFFRETEVFDLLKTVITSEFSNAAKGLKTWCCGCAYGEEAYSLGIILNECLKPENLQNTKIFATDIDNESLDIARKGIYREELLQNVDSSLRDKYFIKINKGYKVKYIIRNMVRYGRLDIVKDFPLSKIDILFCRNLFMYFEKKLQREVFEKLDFALKPGGILVLGKAEILPASFLSRYKEIKERSRVYRKGGTA